jgi:long-chain acyl-CoA synthetase
MSRGKFNIDLPAENLMTLATVLSRAGTIFAQRTAILDPEGNMTWSEYVDRIRRAAGVLTSLGLKQGDRFGTLSLNSFRQAEIINAGYWSGIIPVPVNYRLSATEIRYILDYTGCHLLVVDEKCSPLLEQKELSDWQGQILYLSPQSENTAWSRYEVMMAYTKPAPVAESARDDTAILLHTGGTTGRSKGVPLTHGNILSNALQIGPAYRISKEDRFLHVLPIFHSADLFGTIFTLVGGAHVYQDQFSPSIMLQMIQEYRITVLSLAPTLITLTLQDPDFHKYDTSSIRCMNFGAAPLDAKWIKRIIENFPHIELQQSYGLTETSPLLTTLNQECLRQALKSGDHGILRSVGKALDHVALKVVDDDDNELPAGKVGEVVVQGPNVMGGYLGLDEENAQVFRGGWFHTGDLGLLDEQNNLFLVDRKKDMIITGGENVYCAEVEAALYKYPGVSEAAVVGVPDEKWGEAVFAAIVPAAGHNLDKEAIIEHCRQYIAGYKIPRCMAFVDSLPRSTIGKVLKHELRRQHANAGN